MASGNSCSNAVLPVILDRSIIAPVFTVIYYVLQKRHIEKLSLLLIPASYFIFRNILYYETQVEYVVGTISIFLAALLVYLMMGKASENRKGRIPGIVFYAYYSVHLIIIWIINLYESVFEEKVQKLCIMVMYKSYSIVEDHSSSTFRSICFPFWKSLD